MKSGAGDDPFAEPADGKAEPEDQGEDGEPEVGSETRPSNEPAGRDRNDETARRERAPSPTDGSDDGEADDADAPTEIPWVLRRSRVKEDRDNVHQFFLRDEYSATEDEIMDAVAEELDIREKDLKKLDVREAMVATADVEAIAATLSEWGYEYVD